MGREVRMVPKNWEHPKNERGNYQPMLDCDYQEEFVEWIEKKKKWDEGYQEDRANGGYKLKEEKYENMPYEELAGAAPDSRYYMPNWTEKERTHYMMYEDTSEGTPISPAFEKPEDLARWLADNNASAFAGQTCTYEEWLNMIVGQGTAPSAYMDGTGEMKAGVKLSS